MHIRSVLALICVDAVLLSCYLNLSNAVYCKMTHFKGLELVAYFRVWIKL